MIINFNDYLINNRRKTLKRIFTTLAIAAFVSVGTGCSTTGHFVTPPNSKLVVMGRDVAVAPNGTVTTRPFSWGGAGGIPYRLEQDGKVVKQGKLRAKFRTVSIFWPPAAAAYWPMGFNPSITYDLINGTQK